MATCMPPRPEASKITYPEGLKNFLAISSSTTVSSTTVSSTTVSSPTVSSPTVSPTYDLLYGGYSEADGADAKQRGPLPKSPMSAGGLDTEEHHEVWRQINQAHEGLVAQRTKDKGDPDKKLDRMRGGASVLDSATKLMFSPNCTSPGSPNGVEGVANNTNTFFDKTASLMKALEHVGQIHPFAGVAILAFRAVYELELKRRENDKKILAVYGDMRDMMAALAQLRAINGEDEVGPDGVSIKTRMEGLVEETAADIKKCANACDAYLKKKLVVKIVSGPKWETVLARFAGHFHKRRSEFEFALSIHTGLGVDKANAKLDELGEVTREIQERMDIMIAFFQTCMSPEYKEMATRINDRGGIQAVMDNERLLKELVEARGVSDGAVEVRGAHRRDVAFDMDELRAELKEDVEMAMEKNSHTFSRKFEMQRKQIVDELTKAIHREGDRIIDAVTAGPHDRIIDPDLHAIWKEMGWRGSTKARHFVLALRDYFREKMEEKKRTNNYEASRINEHDEWALEWINVTRLQPIVEAFDDDASNFITVTEANDLTTARPRDWSLIHWLAYWAVGWQVSATIYRDKINHLFAKMFSLKSHIHPAVRSSVDTYLHTVWTGISELTSSLEPYHPPEGLLEKFQSYIDEEEQRLREGLEAVRYDIDAMDTLVLVTGPGRIEKYVFPMLYLLLKKDYEVMRLARKKVINKDELWDAADTIEWVLQAVDFRYKDLQDIFRQQKLDPRQQFKGLASGLFEHWRNSEGLWSRNVDFPDHVYDDDEEAQDVKPEDILNYPLDSDDLFDPSGYDVPRFAPTQLDMSSKWPLRSLLGSWCGFIAKGDIYPCQPMFSIHIHALDAFHFEATSRTPNGTPFQLRGKYSSEADGTICYSFVIKYSSRFEPLHFQGYLYDKDRTFAGTWSSSPGAPGSDSKVIKPTTDGNQSAALVMDSTADRFIFKRLPAMYMCCRPDPMEFQINRPRALWKYATATVRELIGVRTFSWSYFKRRRDHRKRYIELLIRLNYADLDEEEVMELARIRQTLSAADARLYETRYDYELRTTPIHLDVNCDHCESTIIGPRIVCLDCESNKTLNLCDDPRCRDSEVDVEKRSDLPLPHLPGHAVFKVRTMMHLREFGKMDHAARAALKRARLTFKDAAELLAEEAAAAENPDFRPHSRITTSTLAKLSCLVCKKRVSKPCWYCISCQGDVFICLECDAKGPLTVGTHDKLHALVRCQDEVHYGPLTVEQRLELIEERFTGIESRFESVDGKLTSVDTRFTALEKRVASIDDKLTRIEEMLGAMYAKSSRASAPVPSRRESIGRVSSRPWTAGAFPPSPPYPRPLPTPASPLTPLTP